jgi:tryptophan 7-halogenase
MSNNREVNNVVVLGGGTAGWLTALYTKLAMPEKNITVIESEDIGILGAGEGSTPHLVSLLDVLNIPISDLVKETGCTIKIGIKFKNWTAEDPMGSFTHPFNFVAAINPITNSVTNYIASCPSMYTSSIYLDGSMKSINFAEKLNSLYKVPFVYDENEVFPDNNRILDYHHLSSFGIHFDARKLADFLKRTALSRDISLVEGIVETVERDSTGDVKKLILDNGQSVDSDFIFDCSGFKRFFPKLFDSEWVDLSQYLPVNAALPFFLPMDPDSIPSVTESVAMDYGWMWKIPLQERYGCGYVFDETLISEEDAKKEVEGYLNREIEPLKTLRFSPGYYKDPWRYNVISLGLSAGFVEPLEATSIWMTIMYAKEVLTSVHHLYERDQRIVDSFNKNAEFLNEEIAAFINFHYLGGREDTDFWKKFSKETCMPALKKYLDVLEYRDLKAKDLDQRLWEIDSWYYLLDGLNYPGFKDNISKFQFHNAYRNLFKAQYHGYINASAALKDCSSHKDFLDNLKKE